jgi:two-component system chemotaxis response regulator CheB
MSGHNIITIGVSADGLETLKTIVGNLPSEFPAAVFIVSHAGAGGSRVLADILSRSGPQQVTRQIKIARRLQKWRWRSKSPLARLTPRRQ